MTQYGFLPSGLSNRTESYADSMIDTKQNSLLRELQVDTSNNYTITEQQTSIRVKESTKLARWRLDNFFLSNPE